MRRIALPNCPAPVSLKLEEAFYPRASTIASAVTAMLRASPGNLSAYDRIDTFKGPY